MLQQKSEEGKPGVGWAFLFSGLDSFKSFHKRFGKAKGQQEHCFPMGSPPSHQLLYTPWGRDDSEKEWTGKGVQGWHVDI